MKQDAHLCFFGGFFFHTHSDFFKNCDSPAASELIKLIKLIFDVIKATLFIIKENALSACTRRVMLIRKPILF